MEWLMIAGSIMFFGGLSALYYYLKKFIGSTVVESVAHQFDIKLEKYKHQFVKELHTLDRRDKYNLAALDKRLEVHQIAFKLSRKMLSTIHETEEKKGPFIDECNGFIDDFFLYLDNTSQIAFREALLSYANYETFKYLLRDAKGSNDKYKIERAREELNGYYEKVCSLGAVLIKSIDIESKAFMPINSQGKDIKLDAEANT